jgi:apolipoprotein N-acyltransferase
LYNLGSPMGSFGTPGYEQYSNLALIQIVSVTGLWGLTFLVNWCGPVINWAWERSFTWMEVRGGLLAFAAVVGCVLAFGGLRLALAQLDPGTVRVHSFSPQLDIPDEEPDMATDLEGFRRMAQALNQALVDGSVREARQGAQIVLWAEMAGGGVEEDANALIARAQEVAQQEGIYLVMGLRIHYPGQDRPWENKLVMIDPSGKVVIDHDKYGATLLYGMMGAGEAKQGTFTVKTADSPYGILSGVVCWDADFPITMRQAGKQRSDIMFVGIGDPDGPMGVLHAQQHVFRAIENGFSLVRHDNHTSWSLATDPYGRIIAQVDLGTASEWTMVAQVPTHGVFTLYSVVGDLFGWLAVIGFVGMAGWAILRRPTFQTKAAD